jgi:putative DNA primase/helicase
MAPPEPRPLYNQPGMVSGRHVVLVEGEKCAQALIASGVVATTAMHGANAPVDKTDWSPLARQGRADLARPRQAGLGLRHDRAIAGAPDGRR